MFLFSSRRRHTRCALVTGVQTCALPICPGRSANSGRAQRRLPPIPAENHRVPAGSASKAPKPGFRCRRPSGSRSAGERFGLHATICCRAAARSLLARCSASEFLPQLFDRLVVALQADFGGDGARELRRIFLTRELVELRPGRFHHRRGGAEVTRSEEHTSELQSLMRISYAVFCLNTKNTLINN